MEEKKESGIKIQELFKLMVDKKASDLHLSVGAPPGLRINGHIVKVKTPPLDGDDIRNIVFQILSKEQKDNLIKNMDLDLSFGVKGLARFRANIFYSKKNISAVFRLIPSIIPDFGELNLPNTLIEMTNHKNGLILVTGPTGSGKSTTLASLIDRLNREDEGHIITLEDPVEFIYQHKKCVVNQREVGTDTSDFKRGIKSLLRQDPDIVLIGELRDSETIQAALTIAETGHLVFGTLHTNSSIDTINRIINVFPAYQQDQVRMMLSFVLRGVVSQQLIKKIKSAGRCMAIEILVPNPAIKNLIREDKIHQIYSQMQVGQDRTGMVTMNQSLKRHVDRGNIDLDSAINYSPRVEELMKMLGVIKKGA
ncbi:MAG: type IV pilus twitching motility protein PilT [Halobacteriovoraceae bacterium]|nr:type IV pilus twitching motility protein PilT [Halobacteriovoraceae bacterium]